MAGRTRTSVASCDVPRVPFARLGGEEHGRRTTVASARLRRVFPSETRKSVEVVMTTWPCALVDPVHPVRCSTKRQVLPRDANLRTDVSMGEQQIHPRDTFKSQATTDVRMLPRQIAPNCRFYGTDGAPTAPNHLLVRPGLRSGRSDVPVVPSQHHPTRPHLHHVFLVLRRGLLFDPRPSTVRVHVHEASTCRTRFPTREATRPRTETIETFHRKISMRGGEIATRGKERSSGICERTIHRRGRTVQTKGRRASAALQCATKGRSCRRASGGGSA